MAIKTTICVRAPDARGEVLVGRGAVGLGRGFLHAEKTCRLAPACPRTPLAPAAPAPLGMLAERLTVACPPHSDPQSCSSPSASMWARAVSASGPGAAAAAGPDPDLPAHLPGRAAAPGPLPWPSPPPAQGRCEERGLVLTQETPESAFPIPPQEEQPWAAAASSALHRQPPGHPGAPMGTPSELGFQGCRQVSTAVTSCRFHGDGEALSVTSIKWEGRRRA